MPKKPDPILIPCEGSGARGHLVFGAANVTMCVMCGTAIESDNGVVPQHDRNDILAMLQRGDFDEMKPRRPAKGSTPIAVWVDEVR